MNRYQKEMDNIHAPRELIESTKLKCKESITTKNQNNKWNKKIIYWLPAVSAAIVFITVLGIGFGGQNYLKNTNMHLGNKEIILNSNEQIIMKDISFIPMEFADKDVVTRRINDKEVLIVSNKKGFYKACIKKEHNYLLIESQYTDLEDFLQYLDMTIK